jgi:L-iditol 2-dehydrogenase
VGAELGADRIININEEDPVKVILEETKGVGADLVVESSGGPGTIQMAITTTKRMGKILMLGLPDEPVTVDLHSLGQENKSIHTVRGEGWTNCGRAVSMAGSGRVNLKRLVTHSFPFDQISEAFKTFVERMGGAIKVTVNPNI